ncbi:MAG: hypothetical protein DHS20C07_17330 [Methyloligella sp.]|nr:MAG: hypothetical protein DHS20C07_17330 [Methyloligella sp.]
MDDVLSSNFEKIDKVLTDFHKNIHSALLYRNVYEEIGEKASKINDNNHGYSLGIYQKLALESMVLKVCNAYEPLEKQYTKYSVGQILELLKGCEPIEEQYLVSFIDSKYLEITAFNDLNIGEKFIKIISSKMPNRNRSGTLKKLIEFRNNYIAHPKFLEEKEDEDLPSLESISELIEWGKEFGEAVSSAYLASYWNHTSDAGRIRTALKRLFKEIEVIEKGPNSP